MPTPGSVLADCDPHTRATRHALQSYLHARLPALLAAYGTVTYADGYAGAGAYAGGEPGAPVIACREAVAALRAGAGTGVRLVLVEEDERRLSRLTYEIAVNAPKDQRVRPVYQAGGADALPPALGEPEGPTFLFLDGRGKPALQSAAAPAGHEADETLLTVDPSHLGDVDVGRELTLTVELVDDRDASLYVVFGTNERRAVETMKDALWSVPPGSGVRYRDPHDPEGRLLEVRPRPDVVPLREAILAHIADADGGAIVADLRAHISRATIYPDAQVVGVLRRLIAERQLENRTAGRLAGRSLIARPRYITGALF